MKLIKSIMSAFAIVLATTACAGNGGENKKSNEPTKEDNKMEVVSLNKAEFLKKVYDFEANPNDWKFEGKRPAIVDFYATWCGPCKALHPVLEELSKEYSGKVDIYQIDVDQEKELAAAFGIRSIPTLLLIPMKEEPRITQGALPKDQLKKAIDEFLLKQNLSPSLLFHHESFKEVIPITIPDSNLIRLDKYIIIVERIDMGCIDYIRFIDP